MAADQLGAFFGLQGRALGAAQRAKAASLPRGRNGTPGGEDLGRLVPLA